MYICAWTFIGWGSSRRRLDATWTAHNSLFGSSLQFKKAFVSVPTPAVISYELATCSRVRGLSPSGLRNERTFEDSSRVHVGGEGVASIPRTNGELLNLRIPCRLFATQWLLVFAFSLEDLLCSRTMIIPSYSRERSFSWWTITRISTERLLSETLLTVGVIPVIRIFAAVSIDIQAQVCFRN